VKKKPHESKAQKRALRHFQQAGTAAAAARERKFGPTKAQSAAARHNLATARKDVALRRKHKRLPAKKAKLSPYEVNCCAAEALAASLRLGTGAPVSAEEMLALYFRVSGPEEGAGLAELLLLTSQRGLAGWFPSWRPAPAPAPGAVAMWDWWEHAATVHPAGGIISWGEILPWPGEPDEMWDITWCR